MKSKIDTWNLFIMLSLVVTGSYLLINIMLSGKWMDLYSYTYLGGFSDYFFHVGITSLGKDMYRYSADVCFPPLAYCFYWLFMKMAPVQNIVHDGEWFRDYSQAPFVMYIFIIYNMLIAMMILYVCYEFMNRCNLEKALLLSIVLLLSYPISYMGIKQGNSAIIVGFLMALSWLWIKDDSKCKQEIAMILIAVAAGFKIYPALLGIIYIKRRDWKRVFRLLIYGICFFFIPFAFWGGLDGLYVWIHTIGIRAGDIIREYNTVQGYVTTLLNGFGVGNILPVNIISQVVNIAVFIILIVCFFLNKESDWRDALFLLGSITFCIPNNLGYTLAYLVGALLLFLREENREKRDGEKYLYWFNLIGFILIFSRPVIPMLGKITGGIYTVCYLMLAVNIVWVVVRFIKNVSKA